MNPHNETLELATTKHTGVTSWEMRFIAISFILFWFSGGNVSNAEGWKTFRYDISRSGTTPESVNPKLQLKWIFQPKHVPEPSWPVPGEERSRVAYLDNFWYKDAP